MLPSKVHNTTMSKKQEKSKDKSKDKPEKKYRSLEEFSYVDGMNQERMPLCRLTDYYFDQHSICSACQDPVDGWTDYDEECECSQSDMPQKIHYKMFLIYVDPNQDPEQTIYNVCIKEGTLRTKGIEDKNIKQTHIDAMFSSIDGGKKLTEFTLTSASPNNDVESKLVQNNIIPLIMRKYTKSKYQHFSDQCEKYQHFKNVTSYDKYVDRFDDIVQKCFEKNIEEQLPAQENGHIGQKKKKTLQKKQ